MKELRWWLPEGEGADGAGPGTLLSSRWIQAFVFELPALKQAELEASLRYKVQAMLPVNAESFAFRTRFFAYEKKHYGAAFLSSASAQASLPKSTRELRVGIPLTLPKGAAQKCLFIISTPEGLSSHFYEEGLLRNSFAPIASDDLDLRSRILSQCPGAEVVAIAPDLAFPLPLDLAEKEPKDPLRDRLIEAFLPLDPPPVRRAPSIIAVLLLAAGLALIALSLATSITARERRNEAWRAWLKKSELAAAAPSLQELRAKLIKAQGAPVPELFARLALDWPGETRILDLEWRGNKLTLTANSPSALTSLRALAADPWFRSIHIGDIRTQKDGSETFTIEGGLSIDS